MKNELELVKEFHRKFKADVASKPTLITKQRSDLRFKLMDDEVQEYREGVEQEDLANIAKELADILYAAYGTILEHGLQDVMSDVFKEVHRSNMSKDYSKTKMIKGDDYFEANVADILES